MNANEAPENFGSNEELIPTRETVIRIAREAGVDCDPAGLGDDGIDTWYGEQYLPSGTLTKLVGLAMKTERYRWREVEAYLVASEDGSMSRNNSEALACELLAQIRA